MKKIIIFIVLLLLSTAIFAQIRLKGSVFQSDNEPISRANIVLKNTKYATQSNAQGDFEFKNLPKGKYHLQLSCVGFKLSQQEIELNADVELRILLIPNTILAEEVVVEAIRAKKNAATTYTNMDKASIAAQNVGQDLPFVLQNTPSVVVNSDAGAGVGYTAMRIRGTDGQRTNITINGIPYNDSESGGSYFVNLPDFSSSVDNIQIQRGVGTSTNGSGAFGASVNIQTASAPEPKPNVELNNTFGSFNTWKNTVKLSSGLINDQFSFDARLSQISTDGYIDRASSNLKSFFVSGAYHGKTDLIRFNIFSGKEKTYQAWYGVDAETMKTNRRANFYTYPNQTDNYTQTHYQLLYNKEFSDKLTFNGALHLTRGAGYYEEYKSDQTLTKYTLTPPAGTPEITDLIRQRWLDNYFYGATYNFNYKANAQLNFILGGAINRYQGEHFGTVIWAQNYPSTQVALNGFHRYYDNNSQKEEMNYFLKMEYKITNKWLFFGDLQYRNIDYTLNGPDENFKLLRGKYTYDFVNPKLGFTYVINSKSDAYISYSVANKEPVRKDIVDAQEGINPQSERLQDLEIGYRLQKNNFTFKGNGYGMFYKNQLVETGKINDVGSAIRQNVPQSYRMGIELEAAVKLNTQFTVNVNATLSRNKIKSFTDYTPDFDNGTQIPITYHNTDIAYSPSLIAFAELIYRPTANVQIALQNKYVGSQYLDNTQTKDRTSYLPAGSVDDVNRQLDAYWTSNLNLGYDFKIKGIQNIHAGLLVNNIFNKLYSANGYTYSGIDGGYYVGNMFYPQAGSHFLLSLNVKF